MRAGPRTEPTPNRVSDARDTAQLAHRQDQHTAARVVAARATGVDDCVELLGMLGLAQTVGLPVIDPPLRR
jgi:hypothetical protein